MVFDLKILSVTGAAFRVMVGHKLIALSFFIVICSISSFCNGQTTTNCVTARNESARCVPAEFCRITLTLTKTSNARGLNVRQLSVRYCGTLVHTAYVCCPLPQINIPPPANDAGNRVTDAFDRSLNPVGLGILKSTQCGAIDENVWYHGVNESETLAFPWIVRLTNTKGTPLCVGTLITNQYILTTSHCAVDDNIKMARIDILSESQTEAIIGIEKLIPHPRWRKGSDIGLARMERTIQFDSTIQPICLPISSELANYNLEMGFLVGKDIGVGNTKIFVIPNKALDNTTCTSRKNKLEICVECRNEEECNIGAGSPFFFPGIYLSRTRYVEYFVLWGGLANENFYTKIAPHMKWITDNLIP